MTLLILSSCTRPPAAEVVELTLAFGYKDTRPTRFVGDRYERIFLIEKVIEPCDGSQNSACGFKRDGDDSALFYREVTLKNGERVHLQLTIFASSIGPDDDLNRISEYQTFISKEAEKNFLESLHTSSVIIYIGHSRDGGGPDFFPPKITSTKNIDYKWYRKQRPGLVKIKKEIASIPDGTKPKTLAILSCNSDTYFNSTNLIADKKLEVHTTDGLIYFKDALDAAIEEVSDSIKLIIDRDRSKRPQD